MATEGSVGLGRGYIEGWWTSEDPTAVVESDGPQHRGVRRHSKPRRHVDQPRHRSSPPGAPHGRPGREYREEIASHYDLGNSFFSLFLDETMTYSSGVFTSQLATLAEASHAKYDRLLSKLGVDADHSLLGDWDRLGRAGTSGRVGASVRR